MYKSLYKEHYKTCGKIVLDHMKTPANLLSFLTNCLWWLHGLRFADKENKHSKDYYDTDYVVISMIEMLVPKWQSSRKKPIDAVTDAVEYFAEFSEPNIFKSVGIIISGFGLNLTHGLPPKNEIMNSAAGISMLVLLSSEIDKAIKKKLNQWDKEDRLNAA